MFGLMMAIASKGFWLSVPSSRNPLAVKFWPLTVNLQALLRILSRGDLKVIRVSARHDQHELCHVPAQNRKAGQLSWRRACHSTPRGPS